MEARKWNRSLLQSSFYFWLRSSEEISMETVIHLGILAALLVFFTMDTSHKRRQYLDEGRRE